MNQLKCYNKPPGELQSNSSLKPLVLIILALPQEFEPWICHLAEILSSVDLVTARLLNHQGLNFQGLGIHLTAMFRIQGP